MAKTLDLVVWGATGFTGSLVAEYLCERYGAAGDIKWAIAGRNSGKLDALKRRLSSLDAAAADLPTILADSHDEASLRKMAAQTKVVCTTVGPYTRYGTALVAACIDEGADYCDLTGESPWIREMIDTYQQKAEANKRRIVHCCGFDSIPSDLGVFFLQQAALEQHKTPLSEITFYLVRSKGGLSGGTIASMMEIVDQAKDSSVRKILFDPYALNPEGQRKGPDGRDNNDVSWDENIGSWTAPFFMGPINTRIVRRTNALMNYHYGEDFRYQERMSLPPSRKGWAVAHGVRFGIGAVLGASTVPPLRKVLERFVFPKPGEGPSETERATGFFEVRLLGKGRKEDGEAFSMEAHVRGEGDPGYGATSRMLTEAALCLAKERRRLTRRYGILTPASSMAKPLLSRLQETDFTFRLA